MFIIRTAFWLSLVIMLLPAGNGEGETVENNVDAAAALTAAQSTYGDFTRFCERNPSACETGGVVLSSFGQKARYGAQMVYEYLDNKFGEKTESTDISEKS